MPPPLTLLVDEDDKEDIDRFGPRSGRTVSLAEGGDDDWFSLAGCSDGRAASARGGEE